MNETPLAPKAETATGQKALVLNPTTEPQCAPVVEAPENPDVIEIEFSETDRLTAGKYMDNHECMFCTALRNRGVNVLSTGGVTLTTEEGIFWVHQDATRAENGFSIHEHRDSKAELTGIGPFWKPSIVGKKAILPRVF